MTVYFLMHIQSTLTVYASCVPENRRVYRKPCKTESIYYTLTYNTRIFRQMLKMN